MGEDCLGEVAALHTWVKLALYCSFEIDTGGDGGDADKESEEKETRGETKNEDMGGKEV